jgi:primosomal protein N''
MTENILVALITGGLSLLGVLISGRRTERDIRTVQAVMQERIDELTREVREHNGFARRLPVVEEQIRTLDRRTTRLEQG